MHFKFFVNNLYLKKYFCTKNMGLKKNFMPCGNLNKRQLNNDADQVFRRFIEKKDLNSRNIQNQDVLKEYQYITDRDIKFKYDEILLNNISALNTDFFIGYLHQLEKCKIFSGPKVWDIIEKEILTNRAKSLENILTIKCYVYAFAKTKNGSDKFWDILLTRFYENLNSFNNEKNILRTLYGFALSNKLINNEEMKEKIFNKILKQMSIKNIDVYNYITFIECIASLKYKVSLELEKEINETFNKLKPRMSLDDKLKAFYAMLKIKKISSNSYEPENDIYSNLLTYFEDNLTFFSLKQLSNTAYICSTNSHKVSSNFWNSLEKEIIKRHEQIIESNNLLDFSQICYGFGNKNKGSEELWNTLEQIFYKIYTKMDIHHISHVILGFSKNFNYEEKKELYDILAHNLVTTFQRRKDLKLFSASINLLATIKYDDDIYWKNISKEIKMLLTNELLQADINNIGYITIIYESFDKIGKNDYLDSLYAVYILQNYYKQLSNSEKLRILFYLINNKSYINEAGDNLKSIFNDIKEDINLMDFILLMRNNEDDTEGLIKYFDKDTIISVINKNFNYDNLNCIQIILPNLIDSLDINNEIEKREYDNLKEKWVNLYEENKDKIGFEIYEVMNRIFKK